MRLLAHIVMLGWIPFVLSLFLFVRTRTAALAALIISWLFLPMVGYELPYLPDYTKVTATCWLVTLGIVLFDTGRLLRYRFHWIDLFAVAWCLCPLATSVINGLGVWDGLSGIIRHTSIYGLPYLIGRLYFADTPGMRSLALGLVLGGLVYLPLCLYEVRMSPQLHNMIYGFYQHDFGQTLRWGGYRPMVFMEHGLMVSVWMASATLVAFWLWKSRAMLSWQGVPMVLIAAALFVTTVLCRSTGALALLLAVALMLLASSLLRTRMLLLAAVLTVPMYLGLRITDTWHGAEVVSLIEEVAGEDRAGSLRYRLAHEQAIVDRVGNDTIFGLGGWGRSTRNINRTIDGIVIGDAVTDSLWIIAFGQQGLVGLAGLFSMLLVPPVLLFWSVPRKKIPSIEFGPTLAVTAVVVMYAMDCMVNAMINPVFLAAAGAVAGHVALLRRPARVRQRVVATARVAREPLAPNVPDASGLESPGRG